MEELMMNVNWTAVVVGFVAAFGLGWLWYSDMMFGQKWRDGIGIAIDDNSPMAPAMISQAVGTFLLAWVIGITATTDSLMLAILIALTISVLVKANGFFAQKSRYAIAVESSYILAMVVVMIIAHAIF